MPADLPDPVLAALVADAEAAQARLRAYLVLCSASPLPAPNAASDWPDDPAHPTLISTGEAARRCGRSADTIVRWCESRDIGRRYGTRWRVSVSRLRDVTARTS